MTSGKTYTLAGPPARTVTGASPLARGTVVGPPPRPLTQAEQGAVMRLLEERRPRPLTVVIGSSRDTVSRETAKRLDAAWRERGGTVLDVLDWPEEAASWLRQARRFTAQAPDAWIVTGRPAGWVQMGRRLTLSTDWDPARTVATASLAVDHLIAQGGIGTFDHLCGAHRDGSTWTVFRTLRDDHLSTHSGQA
ncbi:hypothetical protein AB0M44_05390 [Streptosporangium subroseum]|uniref:hypothetical protein n=1 Tax=Streptosporangium subroseum TaxID=106412 RepID=UPI003437E6AA